MKHLEENLSKHPLVIKIIDSKTVRCKCDKDIRWIRNGILICLKGIIKVVVVNIIMVY